MDNEISKHMDEIEMYDEFVSLTLERTNQVNANTRTVLTFKPARSDQAPIEIEIICRYVHKKGSNPKDFIEIPINATNEEIQMIFNNAVQTVRGIDKPLTEGLN